MKVVFQDVTPQDVLSEVEKIKRHVQAGWPKIRATLAASWQSLDAQPPQFDTLTAMIESAFQTMLRGDP